MDWKVDGTGSLIFMFTARILLAQLLGDTVISQCSGTYKPKVECKTVILKNILCRGSVKFVLSHEITFTFYER
jgi:hypothetical protein